jgi:apolipoprotein D and lipocalin family protein
MWRQWMLAGLLAASLAGNPAQAARNAPVAELDLARYAGTWHEIAHLPMFFQRNCVGDITATYTPLPDGGLEVRNACRTRTGGRDEATGLARAVDGQPGALQVRFVPGWLAWVPGVWADYWVVALDPDYQWALVGSPTRRYLWILSRSPRMDKALFERLVGEAEARGYPTRDLVLAAPVD